MELTNSAPGMMIVVDSAGHSFVAVQVRKGRWTWRRESGGTPTARDMAKLLRWQSANKDKFY